MWNAWHAGCLVSDGLRQKTVLRWAPERIRALQQRRLRALVAWAKARSPFYAERLRDVDPDRFELAQLPTLTKAEMMADFDRVVTDRRLRRADLEAFIADPGRLGRWYFGEYAVSRTSGTQGVPALIVQDRRMMELLFAVQMGRTAAFPTTPLAILGRALRPARLAVVTIGRGSHRRGDLDPGRRRRPASASIRLRRCPGRVPGRGPVPGRAAGAEPLPPPRRARAGAAPRPGPARRTDPPRPPAPWAGRADPGRRRGRKPGGPGSDLGQAEADHHPRRPAGAAVAPVSRQGNFGYFVPGDCYRRSQTDGTRPGTRGAPRGRPAGIGSTRGAAPRSGGGETRVRQHRARTSNRATAGVTRSNLCEVPDERFHNSSLAGAHRPR